MLNIMVKKFAVSFAVCAAALVICACNGGGSSAGAPGAPAAMAGAGFAFNPTVVLTDGTNFTYTNTEPGSTFPPGPITGTYTFTRNSDTQVTITLNGTGIGGTDIDTVDYVLTNFSGSASSITKFNVTVDGSTYSATVVSGTVTSAPKATGGGIPNGTTPATIDPGFVGTHLLTYHENSTPSPFTDLQQVSFEITSAGELKFQGRTLKSPFFLNGNTFEVIWYDGTYGYAASGDGSLNEINIGAGYDYYTPGAFTFLGQFNDR